MEGVVIFGQIALVCIFILLLYGLSLIYFYIRPPISITIKRLGTYYNNKDSLDPDNGKPCIEFLIDNYGGTNSLNPSIKMSYISYKAHESIINRAGRIIRQKQKPFKVKSSVKDLNLSNELKELCAIYHGVTTSGLVAFQVLRFNFNRGGTKRLFFVNTLGDEAVGFTRFVLLLLKYALLRRLTYQD